MHMQPSLTLIDFAHLFHKLYDAHARFSQVLSFYHEYPRKPGAELLIVTFLCVSDLHFPDRDLSGDFESFKALQIESFSTKLLWKRKPFAISSLWKWCSPPLTLNHASSLSINFRPSTRLKENCGICRTNLNIPQNSRSSISKHVLVLEATTNTSWSSKCTWGTYTQFLFMRMPANSSMKSYISISWEAPWWTTLLIKLLFGVSSGELYYILPLTQLHISIHIYIYVKHEYVNEDTGNHSTHVL